MFDLNYSAYDKLILPEKSLIRFGLFSENERTKLFIYLQFVLEYIPDSCG